jgi:hypothetical protein
MNCTENEDTAAALHELSAALQTRRQRASEAAIRLDVAAPILTKALRNDTHQSQKIRGIIWSLYNASHPVALGDVCSGLDLELADAVIAAITALLMMGAEAEARLKEILMAAGEFERYERAEKRTPEGMPVPYPALA